MNPAQTKLQLKNVFLRMTLTQAESIICALKLMIEELEEANAMDTALEVRGELEDIIQQLSEQGITLDEDS